MELGISFALQVMLVYIFYLIEPGLTIWAAILLLPWMTERGDMLMGRLFGGMLKLVRTPAYLRLRLTIALMFWPTILKFLGLALLWVLVAGLSTAEEMRFILAFGLYSLLLAAFLAIFPMVTEVIEPKPTLNVNKETGYKFAGLANSMFLLFVAMWLWIQSRNPVSLAAILVTAVFHASRFFGCNLPLNLLYFSAMALLLLVLMEPTGSQFLWITGVFLGVILLTHRKIIWTMVRNFRRFRVVQFLKSQRSMEDLDSIRD